MPPTLFSVASLPATYRKTYVSVAPLPAAALAGLFEHPESDSPSTRNRCLW